jgi:uncharacterized protein (DUF2236 family)
MLALEPIWISELICWTAVSDRLRKHELLYIMTTEYWYFSVTYGSFDQRHCIQRVNNIHYREIIRYHNPMLWKG